MPLQATARQLSLVVIAASLLILGWSFTVAPYISKVGNIREEALETFPKTPAFLYRNERTDFFYTSADLLRPEEFGAPGQFIQSFVFDISPIEEGASDAPGRVATWIIRIWNALKIGSNATAADFKAAENFRAELGGKSALDRGSAKVFEIDQGATFRVRSGITHFAAIAIRIPEEKIDTGNKAPQLFPQAVGTAFQALAAKNSRSAGVPRMIVRTTVGEPGSRVSSWSNILREVDGQARVAGMTTILYGGWSMQGNIHELTDSAFRSAWESYKVGLARQAREIVHEQLRLSALIVLAALITWHVRRSVYTWQRILALAILASGFAYSIAHLGEWLTQATTASAAVIFAAEAAIAVLLGAIIESVVRFDPKKIITAEK